MASHEAKRYISDARALVNPVLGPVVVSFAALTSITAVGLKHFIAGSSWVYCLVSAALIMLGVSLCVLSTTIAIRKAGNGNH